MWPDVPAVQVSQVGPSTPVLIFEHLPVAQLLCPPQAPAAPGVRQVLNKAPSRARPERGLKPLEAQEHLRIMTDCSLGLAAVAVPGCGKRPRRSDRRPARSLIALRSSLRRAMPMQTPPRPPTPRRFLAVFRRFWFWWWVVGLSMLGPLWIFAACDMASN